MATPLPAWEIALPPWVELGIYSVLTVLVWGLFAADRGPWQDDIAILGVVQSFKAQDLAGLFNPIGPATRRLLGLPYIVALWSGIPALVLQALYGLTWLGNGWMARALCLELLPKRPTTAFLAGAVTLCATSDFLTNSLVSFGYDLSVLAFVVSCVCALRWLHGRSWLFLAGSVFFVSCSFMTTEGALTSMILAPFLFLVGTSGRFSRRLWILLAAWVSALAPFLWHFLAFLRDPSGYAAVALVPMGWIHQARMGIALVANNFLPWQWLLHRPIWCIEPLRLLPLWLYVLGPAAGATLVFWALLRRPPNVEPSTPDPESSPLRVWIVAALAIALTVAANAAFTRVQFAQIFYRTHVMSRIWASIAVVSIATGLAILLGRRARVALVVPAAFVIFGIGGGLERQDYYLSSWRAHRTELRSIVEQVPALRPGARLILFAAPYTPYQAMEAPYLGRSWLNIVYDDPAIGGRTFFWVPGGSFSCSAESTSLRCCDLFQEGCGSPGGPAGAQIPYSEAVVLVFSSEDGRYHLQDPLPDYVLSGHPEWAAAYDPQKLIEKRKLTPLGRRLLYSSGGLGRFIP